MNNYQPKVTNTQQYKDSQGSHVVTPAKLILVEVKFINAKFGQNRLTGDLFHISEFNHVDENYKWLSPILISETEPLEFGDWVYNSKSKEIYQITEKPFVKYEHKILALPEHFSDKHLQAIVDGKMEEGEVLVKCVEYSNNDPLGGYAVKYYKKVHLNQQNHITLFPVNQSLEEAANNYAENSTCFGNESNNPAKIAFIEGVKWAKNNNY